MLVLARKGAPKLNRPSIRGDHRLNVKVSIPKRISNEELVWNIKGSSHHRLSNHLGIGRIIYCLYEHSFYTRTSKDGDEQLNVFRFPPLVAPIKCTVFPLVQNQQYEEVAKKIAKSLIASGISYKIDITGTSIGKRYARTDELGVPLAVTVDSTTSVTVRERDSKQQIRVDVAEVAALVKDVTDGVSTWNDILFKYPAHTS